MAVHAGIQSDCSSPTELADSAQWGSDFKSSSKPPGLDGTREPRISLQLNTEPDSQVLPLACQWKRGPFDVQKLKAAAAAGLTIVLRHPDSSDGLPSPPSPDSDGSGRTCH
jgi:hypothetical protein